jgi:homoserine O-acetyltransferase/O-succinyltransferase
MTAIPDNSVGIVRTKTMQVVEPRQPLKLDCGRILAPIDVAYETYGSLNDAGDNAVLICHALSGNAHVAGRNNPDDKKPGWWDNVVGPGKGIDTNKYFVICSNFLGGCSGTTGPCSINPATGKRYGLDFPIITIADMVRVQKLLLDKLGIKQLLAVIGGSIGGMQVLQWSIEYPDFVKAAIPIATTAHLGAQSIAFDAVGRNAILADANFAGGLYNDEKGPDQGLAIARMIGHITYLSEKGMREKFGRQLRNGRNYNYDFKSEFAVETYLDYQGQSFVERFDANSYLYITKAEDYFDFKNGCDSLSRAFEKTKCKFLIISFTSDWLFTPEQSETMVNALIAAGKEVSFCNIESPYGHDAFLLEPKTLGAFISGFLDAAYKPEIKKQDKPVTNNSCGSSGIEQSNRARIDYDVIESIIEPASSVLDIGCGNGELLAKLSADKNIKGGCIELVEDLVLACVQKGLPVIQHNIERGLADYADKSYDYVILSQTLQTVQNTEKVLMELLRIGRKVIVSFPNFAHWRCRAQLLLNGRAPVTKQLPCQWYNSANIHCLSMKDFESFCEKLSARIERKIPLSQKRPSPVRFASNLLAEQVVYVISKD